MSEMFGEAWSPMSVPDLAPDDDDDESANSRIRVEQEVSTNCTQSSSRRSVLTRFLYDLT